MADDYFHALVASGYSWGEVNSIAGVSGDANVTKEGITIDQGVSDSYKRGNYTSYDNPASASMFDNLNKCGCVLQLNLQANPNLNPDNPIPQDAQFPATNNLQDGCGNYAAAACAENSTFIDNDRTWNINNLSSDNRRRVLKLRNACLHFWNTLVNDTYNKKNNITDRNDPNYVQICSTNANVAKKDECKVCGFPCKEVSFIGPGIILYKNKQYEYKADSKMCPEAKAKIDIVAQ